MSRAFVKEPDGDGVAEEVPERPVSLHPNYVTPRGLAQIDEQLKRLESDYAASSEDRHRATVARDLRYWRSRRASAEVVPPAQSNEVRFGSSFTIRRADGRVQSFRIVGEDEADPAAGSISYVSPLARAVSGKAVGDVLSIGNDEAEIIEVS
jgi:transcription elongation GreA/GreB family factor